MNIRKMNKGLDFLRGKYGAAKGEMAFCQPHAVMISAMGMFVCRNRCLTSSSRIRRIAS